MSSAQPLALEIACDETGYEGEKLIDTTTDVFAHASVVLPIESAADCMRELRERIRSPAEEYKANHILRQKHRGVLTWFLGETSPVQGQALVFLIDKEYFLLRSLVDLLEGGQRAHEWPDVLYRVRRAHPADDAWHAFLVAANDLLRSRGRPDGLASVDSFFLAVALLRGTVGECALQVIDQLSRARARAEEFCRQPVDDRFDPLTPAIRSAVAHWSAEGRAVAVLHDQQNTLSPGRIAHLTASINAETGRRVLSRLSLVDSRTDPRVQVADIVGGATRKIAQDLLHGIDDEELTALLPPFVSAHSIWPDDRAGMIGIRRSVASWVRPCRTAATSSTDNGG